MAEHIHAETGRMEDKEFLDINPGMKPGKYNKEKNKNQANNIRPFVHTDIR
jgi:hypothetical protein